MKSAAKYTAAAILGMWIGFAIWMNVFAFTKTTCAGVNFSLTWPVFALDAHTDIGDVLPAYRWLEMKIVGMCL